MRIRFVQLITALALVWAGQSTPVFAQSGSLADVDSRLQRVERVLDQSLLELLQRIDGLQQEIRQLRGEIESQTYELETLKKRNRGLYLDTDKRIADLEDRLEGGFGDGLGADTLGGGFSDEIGGGLDEIGGGSSAGGAVIVPSNNRSAPAGNRPAPPARPVSGASTRAATQAEKTGYAQAYDLLAGGQNEAAVAAFDAFLIEYPDGPLSDNAWYWQGEAHYAARNFDDALRNFDVVVESFPASPKVPDARLKIGFTLYEQQRFDQARQVLTGVQNDYPGRSTAVLARKRLQQMDREGR